MPNETESLPPVAVFYTPEFKRNIRQLAKKYRRIKTDVQPLLDALTAGQTPGDQISGVEYEVFKVRMRNTDSGKGKSGGYRIIYRRMTDGSILLITIYSKTEQADVEPKEIRQIILDYATQQAADEAGSEVTPSDTVVESGVITEPERESEQMKSGKQIEG